MSLQKIGKYTEIFENSRRLQRITQWDSRRINIIQNIAIAGLIDSGAPYECENGQIIIDTGLDYKSVLIADIYPYLSPEGANNVIIKNAKKAELPPPDHYPVQQQYNQQQINQQPQTNNVYSSPYNYEQQQYNQAYQPYQNINPQPQTPEKAPEEKIEQTYQTKASKDAEKKADPIKAMMDGLEDYKQSDEDKYEDIDQLFKQGINNESQNNNQPNAATPDTSQIKTPVVPEVKNKTEQGTDVLTNNASQETVEEDRDIIELNKNGITYERCNIEIINIATNKSYRFSVHTAPLTEENNSLIIARFKMLGKDANYMKTQYGENIAFTIDDAIVTVTKNNESIFSCTYAVSEGYILKKLNVETGGNKGNLVIYDNNLELRIYPFPNVRDKNTQRLIFGNNSKGEAAFLYYIKNGNEIIASSGSERRPEFIYDNVKLEIKAKWFKDIIRINAEEV